MATYKTTAITDHDAGTIQSGLGVLGKVMAIPYTFPKTAAITDADVIQVARIPAEAIVLRWTSFNDALPGCTAVEFGIYTDAGVVVDADAYASAVTFANASVVGVENAFEARDINRIGQRVWQDAGASANPGGYYRFALTLTTGGTAAGDISGVILAVVP